MSSPSIRLPVVEKLAKNLPLDPKTPSLIQVLTGPRQVGKTTSVQMFLQSDSRPSHYASADGELAKDSSWLTEQWTLATQLHSNAILVIDEIQKVENWSEEIKRLWDLQKNHAKSKLSVVLLGSSSLQIQKGLSESLAGRFQLHTLHHWNLQESSKGYGLDLDEYLVFGGYPGSYLFRHDRAEWLNYLQSSIVEPVIGKDILSIHRVKSPALFKQCFDLACSYPAQEVSYNKLLGQLQSKGNVELVKHYLELLEGAFLIRQLHKYSKKAQLSRTSSPKLLPLCPALYSVQKDADLDTEAKGRAFELVVGAALHRLPGHLFYWRERNLEVDYVYEWGRQLWAIEVKYGKNRKKNGLQAFQKLYPKAQLAIIDPENFAQMLSELVD